MKTFCKHHAATACCVSQHLLYKSRIISLFKNLETGKKFSSETFICFIVREKEPYNPSLVSLLTLFGLVSEI